MKDIVKSNQELQEGLSRREALAKAGKYASFTAVGMIAILAPLKAVAVSDPVPLGNSPAPSAPTRRREE